MTIRAFDVFIRSHRVTLDSSPRSGRERESVVSGREPSVLAIVLTHDSPTSLSECLDAIAGQSRKPDEILVVDNDSRPPARATIASLDGVEVGTLELRENLGPAGGHAAGLQRFQASGHDLAWVMDDDCVPDAGCLEVLLRNVSTDEAELMFPRWIDQVTDTVTDWPAWCGVLIPIDIVRTVGLPRVDFFWWMEDTEYLYWRIVEAGFNTRRITKAVVWHRPIRRRAVRPPWKIYYETRNSIYYRLRIQKGRGRRFFRLWRTLSRTLGSIVVTRDAASARAFVRGVVDGLIGRLGKTIDPDDHGE